MTKYDEIPLKKGEPTEALDIIKRNLSGTGPGRHTMKPFANEPRPPRESVSTIVGPRTESLEIIKQIHSGTYVAKSATPPLDREVVKTDTLLRTRRPGPGMPGGGPRVYWNPGDGYRNFVNPSPLHQHRAALLKRIDALDPYKDGELEERLRLRKEIEKIDELDSLD